jgi:hypothetical protein
VGSNSPEELISSAGRTSRLGCVSDPKLAEERLGQGLGIRRRIGIGQRDVGAAAFSVGAGQCDRLLGGKAEGDEEGRIIDIDLHRLAVRIDRRLERQGEVQGEQGFVVVHPIVDGRLQLEKLVVFALVMHEGEIVEVLERLDVHLGEGLELLLRVDAVLVGVEALDGHGGVELVERPGMTNAGDLVIRV